MTHDVTYSTPTSAQLLRSPLLADAMDATFNFENMNKRTQHNCADVRHSL